MRLTCSVVDVGCSGMWVEGVLLLGTALRLRETPLPPSGHLVMPSLDRHASPAPNRKCTLCKNLIPCTDWAVTGQNPPGHVPPGHVPPGHLPQGHIPPGHLPPGHLPPGHLPPRTYTPQDIYPPAFKMHYLVHASCVDYILHFKKHLFCRNSIYL